jgi:hypothetical protein
VFSHIVTSYAITIETDTTDIALNNSTILTVNVTQFSSLINDTSSISYQWYKTNPDIEITDAKLYEATPLITTSYFVEVTIDSVKYKSLIKKINVYNKPTIIIQPISQSITPNTPTTLYVRAGIPIRYYSMNGNINDLTGTLNGTLNGTVPPSLTTDRFNSSDKAYSFNGSSSYISIPSMQSSRYNITNTFSISVWIYPTSISTSTIISQNISDYDLSFETTATSTFLSFSIWIRSNMSNGKKTLKVLIDPLDYIGKWNNISAIYDGENISLYKNDSKIGYSDTPISGNVYFTGGIAYIGCNEQTLQFFNGSIGEVSFYISTGLTYQWYKKDSPDILGDSNSYTVENINESATYFVRVFNNVAFTDSDEATVTLF